MVTTVGETPRHGRRPVLAVLCLTVMGLLAFRVDYTVAKWMAHDHLRDLLGGDLYAVIQLSESFSHGMVVALILLLIVRLDTRGWRAFPYLAVASLGAGMVADLCKTLIARTRPYKQELIGDVFDSFGAWFPCDSNHDYQSFPSAHTAVATGLAYALTRLYPRGRGYFLAFAALAALQRMASGAHYLSDIAFGAVVGITVGSLAGPLCPNNRANLDRANLDPANASPERAIDQANCSVG